VAHQLLSHLLRERRLKAASNVDCHQFLLLALVVFFKFRTFKIQFSFLGVLLRVDGYVLPGSHGHGSRYQTGNPCNQDVAVSRMGSSDSEYQTRR
jgi:hypothetical protein